MATEMTCIHFHGLTRAVVYYPTIRHLRDRWRLPLVDQWPTGILA